MKTNVPINEFEVMPYPGDVEEYEAFMQNRKLKTLEKLQQRMDTSQLFIIPGKRCFAVRIRCQPRHEAQFAFLFTPPKHREK